MTPLMSLAIAQYLIFCVMFGRYLLVLFFIRVITKLPNSEQCYKGKVKTHKNIYRQNQ